MQIGLRQVSADTMSWLRNACKSGDCSRASLAREISSLEGWLDYRGRPRLSSGHHVLPVLAHELGVSLPSRALPVGDAHVRAAVGYPDLSLSCTLAALGVVSVDLVSEADRRCWDSMMESHHRGGWRRAPGGLLRYWIRSSRYGIVGGLCFTAAGLQLKPRDDYIGWSAAARLAHIQEVVCNHRFLILPSVRVRHLASTALRAATARVATDWQERYGVRPLLLYTFVAPGHSGLSYRAAGWECCPQWTSGRRSGVPRAVWVKPLEAGWKAALTHEEAPVLGRSKPLYCDGSWAQREYARSSYPDGRVRRRIAAMGKAWQKKLGASIPVIFPRQADQTAAYRLLSRENVTMKHILEPHYEATVDRCRQERLVLAIQDTTTVNYDTLSATGGLDDLGGGGKGTAGVLAHCGMAINGVGRPLGLFTMDASFRRAAGKDSVRWVAGLDRARELAAACAHTRVVSVCDREGDFWSLLSHARDTGGELLVRASRSAQRRVDTPAGAVDLWSHVEGLEPLGTRTIDVPGCGGPNRRKARTVTLTLRSAHVDLIAPNDVGGAPLSMLAVSAREDNPKKNTTPLNWLLLSTVGEANLDGAKELLRFYELRWSIERFFHALKTGTRIEDRRLDEADDLKKCLAFDAITAFRVWDLTWLARTRANDLAHEYVPPHDIEMLCALTRFYQLKSVRGPPGPDMDIEKFVILTAGLAGFHPSKRQPLPGTQKLWEGSQILTQSVTGHQAIKEILDQ